MMTYCGCGSNSSLLIGSCGGSSIIGGGGDGGDGRGWMTCGGGEGISDIVGRPSLPEKLCNIQLCPKEW